MTGPYVRLGLFLLFPFSFSAVSGLTRLYNSALVVVTCPR